VWAPVRRLSIAPQESTCVHHQPSDSTGSAL
jgi:hypothetical protein